MWSQTCAFRDAREVTFVDCACGTRLASLAAWEDHLAAAGQHPDRSDLGPSLTAWQRRLVITPRSL